MSSPPDPILDAGDKLSWAEQRVLIAKEKRTKNICSGKWIPYDPSKLKKPKKRHTKRCDAPAEQSACLHNWHLDDFAKPVLPRPSADGSATSRKSAAQEFVAGASEITTYNNINLCALRHDPQGIQTDAGSLATVPSQSWHQLMSVQYPDEKQLQCQSPGEHTNRIMQAQALRTGAIEMETAWLMAMAGKLQQELNTEGHATASTQILAAELLGQQGGRIQEICDSAVICGL